MWDFGILHMWCFVTSVLSLIHGVTDLLEGNYYTYMYCLLISRFGLLYNMTPVCHDLVGKRLVSSNKEANVHVDATRMVCIRYPQ